MVTSITERVALRTAKDFPTEKALREYLKEHPDADKTKHRVEEEPEKGSEAPEKGSKAPAKIEPTKPQDQDTQPKPPAQKGQPEKGAQPPDPGKPEAPKAAPEAGKEAPVSLETEKPGTAPRKPWAARFKALSAKASQFVAKAHEGFQHFLADDGFRAAALSEAKAAIVKAPGKLISNLVETAKDEVKEFKTASRGVQAVLSGKKMTKHQKDAFKTVATHMALAAAAAALAASGPLLGIAHFGQSLTTHIAAKAVSRSLDKLHMLEEFGHVGHGLANLMGHIASEGKKKKLTPDEMMAKLVMASVAVEIENLTDQDLQEALESMEDEEVEKTASMRVLDRFRLQTP